MKTLSLFDKMNSQPYYERLEEWKKETGKKIIGCWGLYVPEEMIHALDILPVILFNGREPITLGAQHWQSYMCGPVRGVTDLACKGKLDFLDGMVIHDCCHEIRGSVDIIKLNAHNIKYIKPIWFPKILKQKQTKQRLLEELKKLKGSLEDFWGKEITVDALHRSIEIYNENSDLMAELYEMRRRHPGIMKAGQMQHIILAGMQMPKEEHNQLLKDLLSEIRTDSFSEDERVKIILSGSLCGEMPEEILDIIEDVGGCVVDDDLYVGSRYFLTRVSDGNDPLEALADRYIDMVPPCPTTQDPSNDLGQYLVNMVEKSRAGGIINIITKFCEAHCHIYPWVRYACRDAGIPELLIETEHEVTSFDPIKTRIQAFVELIKGE
ncbi:MAG: 2-hydroxyacyl-CoA dehydratase [Deltaproteobacteria bacterium]|nr:2-hydroxyacyl-CoA dehydratase [Deltaproteobacteria bacterium]